MRVESARAHPTRQTHRTPVLCCKATRWNAKQATDGGSRVETVLSYAGEQSQARGGFIEEEEKAGCAFQGDDGACAGGHDFCDT